MQIADEVAVFVTRRDGREVLLLRRVQSGGGYWHVVAGSIEAGESPREAARRELQEETGLVGELGESVEVLEYVNAVGAPGVAGPAADDALGVSVTCYRANAPDDWEPTLNPEHDRHRWCTPLEAAAALIWPQTARALRELCMPRHPRPGL